MTKIKKHLKNIHSKSEEDRIKIMWISVIFCMVVILGGWIIMYKLNGNKNKVANEVSRMPSFSELQKNIDGMDRQKENLFEEILDIAEKAELEIVVIDYVQENELIGEENISNLKLENVEKLENNWHIKYQQYYENILVNDSDVSFLIDDAEKKVISHSSNFDSDINLSGVEPKISKEEAFEIAKKDLSESLDNDGDNNFDLKNSELVIYKNENGESAEYYLTWRLNIFSLESLCDYCYFIDAENGEVVFSF